MVSLDARPQGSRKLLVKITSKKREPSSLKNRLPRKQRHAMYRISTQTFRETCIAHGVDPTDALFYVLKESNRASKNDEATWIVQTPTALFFPNDLPWITGLTRDERRACVLKHIQKWIGQLDSIQTDAFVSETYL